MTLFTSVAGHRAVGLPMQILVVVAGSLLIAVSAKISIPFYPVPMTMQTAAITGLALALGMRRGAAVLALYLLEGAVGLPVFAGTPERGIGLAYMAGPTGGYLVGFFLAAVICGWLADRGWSATVAKATASAFVGTAAIFLPGLLWLAVLFGWKASILETGLYPFLFGALLKCLLVGCLVGGASRILRRRRAG